MNAQLVFDGKRLILRNFSFQFFSILMPAGFYLLFTKVMTSGTVPASFNAQYMGSMIVYSGTISAIFGLAAMLLHDREEGLLQWLQLTPGGLKAYYGSIGFWTLVMNAISVLVMGILAVVVNQVNLSIWQWLGVLLTALIGQLPVILLGVMLSFLNRAETLSVISNLVTFPMAIISGLWWPMSILPSWLRPIGKTMPTYFVNDLLGQITTHGTLKATDIMGIGAWIIGLALVALVVTQQLLKRGNGVVKA
ncbi:ABC transporter permease [Lactiplantibacillus mudanjiangensis]|uniref:Multidrug ABC transporter permease [Lactobacillus koreensis] n=1 Tax=Lactiplantibacillus mudanjiangensis TaxID=1296538 RepID=A0A660DZA8_9LACO|nr:ABC transporter permease [Lactiplantibacillus mudanjiangensis]VDG19597.1 multidrug ABC transporter permease [Lactobacillus koreensis] [Lactiplantibacillus mudanjiangensis]VDG23425.1 multidrug ABC transporter permease [Lactobacillus koreensis] [Lactiplantibacillus mudanjiangensis]VDG28581.1 multidrug ABC transporter permease [Lactobacillus koreensis] [Lactiplantibacillus mudanjiangensis]